MGDFDDLAVDPYESEAAVLSTILVDQDALAKVIPLLRPEMFYAERHRQIYSAIVSLFEECLPVDSPQVATRLRDRGRLAQVGGVEYLLEMRSAVPAILDVEAHAEVIARKARLRAAQAAARAWLAKSDTPTKDSDLLIDELEGSVHAIALSRSSIAKPETLRSALVQAFDRLREQTEGKTPIGSQTGLECIDRHTGGLRDGESTILAARPGMGKTGLAMQIAVNIARRGAGIIVFSLEMPNEQIAMRSLCAESGVDANKTRSAAFTPADWSQMTAGAAKLMTIDHAYMCDKPCTLSEIRSYSRARQSDMARANVKLGLVVVDYLQLMQAREGLKSREEAVSENARGLKLLAKELGCPVLALSQLNRSVETRSDKHPMLSDLRESGAIEEAADCVIGMYRDDYYNDQSQCPGVVDLEFLKFRHGSTGLVRARFHAATVSFSDLRDEDGWQ